MIFLSFMFVSATDGRHNVEDIAVRDTMPVRGRATGFTRMRYMVRELMSLFLAGIVTSLICLVWVQRAAAGIDETEDTQPPQPSGSRRQAAHVRFDETMFVAWNKSGVVAIVFEPPTDSYEYAGQNQAAGLNYRWRTNDNKQGGRGTLAADGKEQTLVLPHVRLQAKVTVKRGTFFYDPEKVSLHPVKSDFFDAVNLGTPARPHLQPPANLDHFLRPDKNIQAEFRDFKYLGQTTEPAYPRRPLPFKVRYFEHGLIVANPGGVAVFAFTSPIDRTSGNEHRRGIAYRWRFVSADGTRGETGQGEVWELYRNNQYANSETRHFMEAGPIHIPWSINMTEAGWIYYDPAWHGVWLVAPKTASNLVLPDSPSAALLRFRFGPRDAVQEPGPGRQR